MKFKTYKDLILDKLQQEYNNIPNKKSNYPYKVELIGRMTVMLFTKTKKEINDLFFKKFLYHLL
jgi:hypothetical protein